MGSMKYIFRRQRPQTTIFNTYATQLDIQSSKYVARVNKTSNIIFSYDITNKDVIKNLSKFNKTCK